MGVPPSFFEVIFFCTETTADGPQIDVLVHSLNLDLAEIAPLLAVSRKGGLFSRQEGLFWGQRGREEGGNGWKAVTPNPVRRVNGGVGQQLFFSDRGPLSEGPGGYRRVKSVSMQRSTVA